MKLNQRRLQELKSGFLHIPVVSIALLAAAIGVGGFAAHSAKGAMEAWRTSAAIKKETPSGLIKLNKRPVSPLEIQTLVDTLKANHPSLTVAIGGTPGSLSITAVERTAYREWISALGTVQGASRAGSIWLATDLCLGDCGSVALKAEVQGVVQTTEKGS